MKNEKSNKNIHLTHTDEEGKASMVDVGQKRPQIRRARATGIIRMAPGTLEAIRVNQVKKGDVLAVARVAGIQAVKATPSLIPLCHTLELDRISVEFELIKEGVRVTCETVCVGKTGVEMEALTGVSVALLTVYDMCKALDREMRIGDILLEEKEKRDL